MVTIGCLAVIVAFSVIPLAGYHWYLMINGLTTHEHVRYSNQSDSTSPWSHHPSKYAWVNALLQPCWNVGWTLLRPAPPSYLMQYDERRATLNSLAVEQVRSNSEPSPT
jgi:hypothetical protein